MESQSYLRYESMNQLSKTNFGRYGYFNALGPLSHSLTAHKHTCWNGKRSNRTAKTASMVVDECAREHTVEIYGWGPICGLTHCEHYVISGEAHDNEQIRPPANKMPTNEWAPREKDRSVYWNGKWECGGRPLTEVTPRTPGGRRGGVSPRNKHALLRTKCQRINELRGKRIGRCIGEMDRSVYWNEKWGCSGRPLTEVTPTTPGGRGGAPLQKGGSGGSPPA